MHYLQKELYDRIQSDATIFEFLQRSSFDGLWYWDLTDPEHEWMNAQFWETLGYDPATKPHLASAWQDIINPDDLRLAKDTVGKHLADPNVPYDQVVRYTHANGSTVWIRCRGMAVRAEDGTPLRLIGAHTDITPQKTKEQLLEQSQELAQIGAYEVDVKNGTLYWDEMVRAIHEVDADYVPKEAEALAFYKEGESRRVITEVFTAAMQEGKPFDVELQIVTAKGREVWVRAVGQARMINGECQSVYGVFQDIDERKRGEERLLNYSILEAKSKEMEQFAYVASHDLREPLLTIQGFVDVIREDYGKELPAAVREYLDTITEAGQRMDVLIKGLLDYSRLSEIKQLQPVNIKDIVAQTLTDLSVAIDKAKVRVQVGELPEVMGYPLELKILFQNLISNALKYRRPEVELHIDISCQDLVDGWAFAVRDNGIGIPEHQLELIFQLFRQLHNESRITGSGIGLANCRKIVELHNGEISAESTVGKGTTFFFTIRTKSAEAE